MINPKENTIFSGQSSEFEVKFTSTTPENDYVLIGEQTAAKNIQTSLPNLLVNLIVTQR